jgi:hypothetical protein
MAGKRQAIIPKFLQKGFANRIDKDQSFTRVYKKNLNLLNQILARLT